jgi:hypothetical protein
MRILRFELSVRRAKLPSELISILEGVPSKAVVPMPSEVPDVEPTTVVTADVEKVIIRTRKLFASRTRAYVPVGAM